MRSPASRLLQEEGLIQAHTVVGVPLGHVGEDDAVAGLEAVDDLDGVDGAAAELDLGADGVVGVGGELEDADGALLLAEGGTADVDDVVEALELDGAVNGEVGTGTAGELVGDGDVDEDGAVLHGGVDAGDLALDDAVAGVDLGDLAEGDVAGLGFRDADLGLELGGIGDAGDVGARLDLGADLDREGGEDAGHGGADLEGVELLVAEGGEGAEALDLGFLDGELGLDGILGEGVALLLDFVVGGAVGGGGLGELEVEGGDEAVAEEFLLHLGAELGGFEVGLGAGGGSLGGEKLALEGHALAGQLGLGGEELGLGVGGGGDDVRVAELEDEGAGFDDGAGAEDDLVDAALGAGGDPADLLGDEGAEAADLADHGAALDGVDPHEVALDRGGRGLQLRQRDGDADQDDAGDGGVDDAFLAFILGGVGAGDVHAVVSCAPNCNDRANRGAEL